MSLADRVTISLPHGFWADDTYYREAELRPLYGGDELFLLEIGQSMLSASRVSAVLARCVTRLGPIAPVSLESLRSLVAGDREALLLYLRRLTFGERIRGSLRCPEPACGEPMDLDIAIEQLLLPPYSEAKQWYEATLEMDGVTYTVRFRLPTGADQEALADAARGNPEGAAQQLLRRCMEKVIAPDGQSGNGLPSALGQRLSALMAERDPQAEITLKLTCPVCDQVFTALLDAAGYLFSEITNRARQIYNEIHYLAFHYHWSLSEIMAMTPVQRRRHVECLADTLESVRAR